MKKLIIYYSFEGSTQYIAESIADEVGADIQCLNPVKELFSRGIMKYFWGGKMVVMKETPELQELKVDFNEYDIIFIGTPVWVGTYAPPLRTFFNKIKLTDKKIALFACHEGGLGKTFQNMINELEGNKIIGQMDFKNTFDNKEKYLQESSAWARNILKGI